MAIFVGPDGGQVPLIKTSCYDKLVALGEGAASNEFWMTFGSSADTLTSGNTNNYPGNSSGGTEKTAQTSSTTSLANLKFLVQTTQIPALQRENIETYGPQGVQFNQMGRYKNAQDIPVTFKEVISGKVFDAIREWVAKKWYLTVFLHVAGESYLKTPSGLYLELDDCWLELDGTDLSVEDGASLIRPSGTLHSNWVHWCEAKDPTSNPFSEGQQTS